MGVQPTLEGGPYARDLDRLKHELEAREDSYLRRWGWACSSHTPGSYWMWSRDFADYDREWDEWNAKVAATGKGSPHAAYGRITCGKDHALQITRSCLDERPEDGGPFDD